MSVRGAGLGLRRSFIKDILDSPIDAVDFFEVAPENWIGLGGRLKKQFRSMTEAYPFVLHGLSLSIGAPAPLDLELVKSVKAFMDEHGIELYTEHLSYCGDDGHLYDLLPIPFTEEAIRYVSERVKIVQDIIERPIALENVSYYVAPDPDMQEIEFINAVLREANCRLLLDVNNIYVNSVNHNYKALDYLHALPPERVAYIHVAGHYNEADDLIIDTHGADVIEPVWELLAAAYDHVGVVPTLLERDFNIPSLANLQSEVERVKLVQTRCDKAGRVEEMS